LDAGEICKKVLTYGTPCEAIVPIENALQKAFEVAGDECLIVAAGSVFIAAAVKDIWAEIIK